MTKNIVGMMRLHNFDTCPELVITRLAQYCDRLVFMAHNLVNPRILDAAASCPKTEKIIFDHDEGFRQAVQLDNLFREVDRMRPKIVLYPDEDEILPDKWAEEMEKWDYTNYPFMLFHAVHCWNRIHHITMNIRLVNFYIAHCKAMAWKPGFSFIDYQGRCLPRYLHGSTIKCDYPLRHLCCLTQELRDRREIRPKEMRHKPDTHWWNERQRQPTARYDPEQTYAQWKVEAKERSCGRKDYKPT